MSGQQAESGVSWFDGILAERQVYVRGRGRPYFVTITRRARVARALALLVLILAFAGTAAGLAGAWRLNGSLRAELASLRADVARSGGDERAARLRAEAELAQEREGWAAASRSRAAELEAVQARATLLTTQLASAEQASERSAAELKTARQRVAELESAGSGVSEAATELDAAKQRIAELEPALAEAQGQAGAAESARAEAATLRDERDGLGRRLAELEAQLQRAASATVATLASIEPEESAVMPQPEQGEDVKAELTAALARLKELESYVGRRAPAPPAQAPR
jgi:DNA repair exonuclease SbcCD ATPase subunit